MNCSDDARRALAVCVALSFATLVIFWPMTGHDFISYDDGIYVTDNANVTTGLKWENVVWAFQTGHGGNWHPLTWVSHMVDVQLFGTKPGWHHFVSLLLHTANSVLLFLVLRGMTGELWRSAFVAALFSWHPLHVESVAWASERKDVLSALFFMLTLWAYGRYARELKGHSGVESEPQDPKKGLKKPNESKGKLNIRYFRSRSFLFYVLALFFFSLGLMSKPMLVTVPFVLLLLDIWPLQRLQFSNLNVHRSRLFRLVVEKLPFFLLTIGSCIVTLLVQKAGGAVVTLEAISFPARCANAVVACVKYLLKTIWPLDLTIVYQLRAEVPIGAIILSVVLLAGITLVVFRGIRTRPYLLAGWFWFLGMLVPVIGLVQVGMQQMADRYTYLPLIGIFMMAAWQAPDVVAGRKIPRVIAGLMATLVLLGCVTRAKHQLGYWKDSEALFGHALEVSRDNYIALYNHGLAVFKKGRVEEAVRDYEAAVALDPNLDAARCGLGEALMQQGKLGEAEEQFMKILEVDPKQPGARLQLGILRAKQGRLEEAAQRFSDILVEYPGDIGAHNNLGNVLAMEGKQGEAVEHFATAVRLRPGHASAHNNLAISYKKLGRIAEAIGEYREALRLQPDSVEPLNNLAWILATHRDPKFRNGHEAVELATRACELTRYQHPIPLATLAAGYGEAGQFNEAIAYAEKALQFVRAAQGAVLVRLQEMLTAFKQGKAYREE